MTSEILSPSKSAYRKTKIVATVGPASNTPDRIREVILAGVNVFRFNFSHGSHEDHSQSLERIRVVSAEMKRPVAILQDLSGPKIRISQIENDFVTIIDNETVNLRPSTGQKSTARDIYVETLNPIEILKAGEQILLSDGIIVLESLATESDYVTCKIVKGGRLRSRAGIAFPDSEVELPATTTKDLADLQWAIKHKIDFVAISFVNNAVDVLTLREEMKAKGYVIPIISKIERKSALRNIDEIVNVSDGLMVARGDLGLELPMEQLPRVQKTLIEKGNQRGIPVIVATQMLHSMITAVRPTRAEVSDIAAAVMTGADAVMLSEESAIGEHPVEAVRYLSKIAKEAEETFAFEEYKLRLRHAENESVPDAVAYAASAAAVKVNAAAIIACTATGNSARLLAKYRPQQPLYGASPDEATLRRMCLYWGVQPISCAPTDTHQDEIQTALQCVQEREGLVDGSRAVITGGLAVRTPGSTSVMEVREMKALA